jgi:arylsulfatase A-like enzyme
VRRGRLALALAVGLACSGVPRSPNILLVTIDTQRADFLGCYGHPVVQTPTLDSLATAGVLFLNATSQCNQTIPSHASLFTSRYVPEHGALSNFSRLPEDVPTLAQHLARLGYDTGALVSTFVLQGNRSGLSRGFRAYDDIESGERDARQVAESVDEVLDSVRPPFFVWVHLFDPHREYTPPAPYDSLYWTQPWKPARNADPGYLEGVTAKGAVTDTLARYMRAQYLGEVSYADWGLAKVLSALRGRGHGPATLLAVTADHGESMTEHGILFEHGWGVYQTHVHVPLVVSWPGHLPEGLKVSQPVELVDLPVTILDLIGAPPLPGARGRSLVDAWERPGRGSPGGCLSHQEMLLSTAWRRGPWKLIKSTQKYYLFPPSAERREDLPHVSPLDSLEGRFSRREILAKAGTWTPDIRRLLERMEANGLVDVSERLELYDVEADPQEEAELAGAFPDTVQALLAEMQRKVEQIGAGPSLAQTPGLTARERDQLRALGYID